MNDPLASRKAFEGDLEALTQAASEVLAALGLVDAANPLTSRLVRDYGQRGILSKPSRRGREALYGFRQLAELVAARALIRDGWPLGKIAQLLASASLEDVLAMVAPSAQPGPAGALAAIQAIRSRAERAGRRSPGFSKPPAFERAERLAILNAQLPSLLLSIGPDASPRSANLIEITLSPDLRVLITPERLQTLSLDEAERIGSAVAAALVTVARTGAKP